LRDWLPARPPVALGVVRSGALLLDAPDGAIVERLPAGAAVTITGRSADERYLAAYTAVGVPGWIAAGSLILYGEEALTEVDEPFGPGPVATMVADAMETQP
jgi:hypothetical protein